MVLAVSRQVSKRMRNNAKLIRHRTIELHAERTFATLQVCLVSRRAYSNIDNSNEHVRRRLSKSILSRVFLIQVQEHSEAVGVWKGCGFEEHA